jgi:hypothetical protein
MPLPDNFPALVFAVLVIFLAGAVVFYAVVRDPLRFSPLERFAYCYPLGLSALGMPMFLMSWAGFHIRVVPVLALIGLAAVIAYAIRRVPVATFWKRNPNAAPVKPFNEFEWFLLLIIVGCLLVRTMTSLLIPLNDGDGHAIWCFKAKIFYYDTIRTTDYFNRRELAYSHTPYPLLVPFMYVWVSTVAGHWDDMGMFILNPTNLVIFAILLYCTLRKFAVRPVALAITAMLSSLPALMHYAECGQADVPLMLISGASVFCLFEWMQSRRTEFIILAGFLLGGALFTKQEGKFILIAQFCAGALSVWLAPAAYERKKLFGQLAAFVGIAIIWALPWLLFELGIKNYSDDFGGRHLTDLRWAEIPTLLHTIMLDAVVFYNQAHLPKWNILWLIFAFAFVAFGVWRQYPWNCLLVAFVLHAAAISGIFLISRVPLTMQELEIPFERFALAMMPPLWLVLGKCLNDAWLTWKGSSAEH